MREIEKAADPKNLRETIKEGENLLGISASRGSRQPPGGRGGALLCSMKGKTLSYRKVDVDGGASFGEKGSEGDFHLKVRLLWQEKGKGPKTGLWQGKENLRIISTQVHTP